MGTETVWLTADEAAKHARCSTWSIYQAARKGDLVAAKRTRWLVTLDSIDNWIEAGNNQPTNTNTTTRSRRTRRTH